MHYYKFNIADWHLATSHLSLEEEAVYFKLINYYYDTECAIPENTEMVIRRLRLGSYSVIVDLILREFFDLQNDGWHHKRCDDEIAKYHNRIEKNKDVGKLGGRPKKIKELTNNEQITQSVSKDNPDITLTTNHKPLTNNQINIPEGVSVDLWKDFLSHRKRLKANVTPRVVEMLIKEANKAQMSLNDVLELILFKGWRSFEAEWVKNNSSSKIDKSWQFSDAGIENKAKELGISTMGLTYQQVKEKCLLVMAKRALQ